MTTPAFLVRTPAQRLGPMHLLDADDFRTPCWRVLSLEICGSELFPNNEGPDAWHPDVWIWFAWSPDEPGLLIGKRPPTTFGVSVGQSYDAVLGVVGGVPVRLIEYTTTDTVSLLERIFDSGILDSCCRGYVGQMLYKAKQLQRRSGW